MVGCQKSDLLIETGRINSTCYTSKTGHRRLNEGLGGTPNIWAGNRDIPQKLGRPLKIGMEGNPMFHQYEIIRLVDKYQMLAE